MLGIYEKRHFGDGKKIWFGRYKNLSNVLHWHLECEIIRIAQGRAQIKVGENCFEAVEGDCFFVAGEELHYIISEPDSQVEVLILDQSLTRDITGEYALVTPKISAQIPAWESFQRIKKELAQKRQFYRQALENHARSLLVDIFRGSSLASPRRQTGAHNQLISKLNEDFAFITFENAAAFCGYSPSHFSKMFKKLSGMSFSEYLNIIKVENAIRLLRGNRGITMTAVSSKCGFSTVRNFNRVFKRVTGYSPRALPQDFTIDTGLKISQNGDFDPTDKNAILI